MRNISDYEYIEHNKTLYQINNGNGRRCSYYTHIIHAIIDRFELMESIYSKLLIIRVDLHVITPTTTNIITPYLQKLNRALEKQYPALKNISWIYANEIGDKSSNPHYHLALILNGHIVQYPIKVCEIVENLWLHGSVWFSKEKRYHFHNRGDEQTKQEIIYRLSYLAKTRSKNHRKSPQDKMYSINRVKSKK